MHPLEKSRKPKKITIQEKSMIKRRQAETRA